ncbi:hypothetical protein PPROV_001071700 [Pycnococcus provasolii]|uniref:Vacuolar protein sorting-associated protein 28 homolog n=1 Tax=Pycnococcus provasolii TaxID=41880 RepID=A0A830I1Q9_9CHLO|nr:hypothetical protein PPROV_001071700 [Pycnococcus provasolii]|mmetsp:Transcript_9273/g.21076  ORF Transcript_9273/g.21076 Transcript_9273/m.21076 type:complete len:216 (-) Transcript_9273:223-870(-)|eukprot:CAMPEP_0119190328 /NCGR_PEP_ID=MMETSP1316-20130426/1443_1 /TAXON_ID=41880 /ORGANISM="Pycnococcus provasolii, Strain RCC2336" /LENGTH=215 /DNA_ID=CAMNT_0007185177 /DNA_START=111 /DNA_END=758 /DNA_ORIENTATION=+
MASELKLWHTKKERDFYESSADLFAILKTCEKLELAYVRGAITPADYEPACEQLIAQFKTLRRALESANGGGGGNQKFDIQSFMTTYNMECPAGYARLVESGMPATLEHGAAGRRDSTNSAGTVAETVQFFITAMDSLKLNMVAVDQVYPLLSDLLQSLHKVPQLPPTFEGKEKGAAWLRTLNGMSASAELDETQVRQLLFDLESAYNQFMTVIR